MNDPAVRPDYKNKKGEALFEKLWQNLGDCGITGRFAMISQASRRKAVEVDNFQEVKQ